MTPPSPDDASGRGAAPAQPRDLLVRWLNRLPAGAVWTDGSDLILNVRAGDILGVDPSEITTLDGWFALLHGDDAAEHRAIYEKSRASGFSRPVRIPLRRRDGSDRAVEVSAFRDAEGEIWLLHDRTELEAERRSAQADLDASRTLLQTLFDASEAALFIVDVGQDGTFRFAASNAAHDQAIGVDRGALIGATAADFLSPQQATQVEARYRTVVQTRRPWVHEENLPVPDPGRWYRTSLVPILDDAGDVERIVGSAFETTAARAVQEELRQRDAWLERAQRAARLATWAYDPDSETLTFSAGAEALLGVSVDGEHREALRDRIVASDRDDLKTACDAALLGDPLDLTVRATVRGAERWMRFSGALENGDGSRLVGIAQDVDEDVRMAEEAGRMAQIVQQAPSIVMLTDLDNRIEYVNDAFERVSGYGAHEVEGWSSSSLGTGTAAVAADETLWETLTAGEPWTGEFFNRRKDGTRYVERATISPLRDASGRITHYVKLAEDVTEQRRMAERVAYLSERDRLTGLLNRRSFRDRVAHALASARRHEDRHAVLALDVDGLSDVNDTFGPAAGDALLREAGDRLRRTIRVDDAVSRTGGDEFAVLLERVQEVDDVAVVVEKIRDAFAEPFGGDERRIRVSLSVGAATFPGDAEDPDTLIGHADAALARAKEQGADQVAYFTSAMNERLQERIRIDGALREGFAANELRLAYQPRVDMASGRVVSLEALARWTSPTLGPVSPGRFIPVAEATGFIRELGAWVIRTATAQQAALRDAGVPVVPIAVNLSVRQFVDGDVVATVEAALREADVPAGLFEVEITESAAMTDVADTAKKIRALERLGVAVSIDDFGTAHSSLGRLKNLGVRSLKIDQGFVRDLGDDPEQAPHDAAIVRAVIAIADALDLNVIAEGVETVAQRDFLLRHGCRIAQGYLYAKPVEASDLEAMLRAGRLNVTT